MGIAISFAIGLTVLCYYVLPVLSKRRIRLDLVEWLEFPLVPDRLNAFP
jgi:hypothetical protein